MADLFVCRAPRKIGITENRNYVTDQDAEVARNDLQFPLFPLIPVFPYFL